MGEEGAHGAPPQSRGVTYRPAWVAAQAAGSLLVLSSLHHGEWGYTYGEADKYSTGRESRRGATHQARKSVHGVKDAVLCVIGGLI